MNARPIVMFVVFVCTVVATCGAADLELPVREQGPLREQGVLNGARFTIQIPEDWNGGLVLFAHGYLVSEAQRSYHLPYIELPFRDDVDSKWGDPASHRVMAAALERGFATARLRYSRVGYMMREGTLETEMLRHYFESTYGETHPTIITGNHGGGTITINLLEKFPESYDGGLALTPLSAPALDSLKERVFDMRLIFDYLFPPGLPGSVVDFSEPVAAAENIPRLLAAHPDKVPVFMKMFDLASEKELASTLGFYCHVLRELSVDRNLGNAFDNTNTLYTGSDDDVKLNREIPRYAADPKAREYLTQWATFTGELSDPLLVVSALEDPIVPAEATRDYDNLTQRKGTAHNFVQMWVPHNGAWYTYDQIEQAFDVLLAWINGGARPQPGELKQRAATARRDKMPERKERPISPAESDAIVGTWDVVTATPMRNVLSVMVFAVQDGELTVSESLAGPGSQVTFEDGVVRFMLDAEGRKQRVEVEVEGDTVTGRVLVFAASTEEVEETNQLSGTRRAPLEGDVAAIADVINRWAETSAANDLDAMMALFSADYRDDILDHKEKLREYWELAMDNGMTDGMRVGFNPAKITITGDTARTGRVYYQAKPGGFYYVFELRREPDGVWLITKSSY